MSVNILAGFLVACRASSPAPAASEPASPVPQTSAPSEPNADLDGLGFEPAGAEAALGASLDEVLAEQQEEDWEAAAEAMRSLLHADLPRWSAPWSSDPRLQALRQSPAGRSLEKQLPELRRRWGEALDRGIPIVYWRASDSADDDPYASAPPMHLRAGVLLDMKRFVPAGPPIASGLALHLLPDRSAVVSISGHAYPGLDSSLAQLEVALWDPIRGQILARQPPPEGYEGPQRVELAEAEGAAWFRIRNGPTSHPGHPELTSWIALVPDPPGLDPSQGIQQVVSAEGVALITLPAHEADRVWVLRLAASDHETVFVHAAKSASLSWIATTESRCTWEGEDPKAILRHRLRRIPKGGPTVLVHEGPGTANINLLADGRTLVQIGAQTYLLGPETNTLEAGSTLTPGLVIAPPLQPKVCFDP